MEIIDAWMQHPSAEFLADPVFDSLRRWAHGRLAGGEVPVAATVAAMDGTAELFLHGNAERVFGLAPAPGQAAGPGPAAGQQDTSTERAQA